MPDKKISKSKKKDSLARREKERIERENRRLNPKKDPEKETFFGKLAEEFRTSLQSPKGKYPGGAIVKLDPEKRALLVTGSVKSGGSVRGVGKAVRGYGKAMSGRK